MAQRRDQRFTLCIALFAAFISTGICCTNNEVSCDSGQCIPSDSLCDGVVDCTDGSDETWKSCIHQNCPKFSYRCAYGACVDGLAKCNKKQDCADNSDETLCDDDPNRKVSNCLTDEFECTSDECISQDVVCDGIANCKDQSDEKVETCGGLECPIFSFRCGYGACISNDKTCDGNLDCRDGSDEAHSLCGTTPPTPKPTPKPTPTPRPRPKPTPKPTEKPDPSVQGCIAPTVPNSKIVYEDEPSKIVQPGQTVLDFTSIIYQCNPGYKLEGRSNNICLEYEWSYQPHPECKPHAQSTVGCEAPTLPHSRLVYEKDPSKEIAPGDVVQASTSIIYECKGGYTREGINFNYCRGTDWINTQHPECTKYCPPIRKGITFKIDFCEKNGVTVRCDKRIKPGTLAHTSCETLYQKPDPYLEYLNCHSNGDWDFEPFRCAQTCGTKPVVSKPFLSGADPINVTYVPWHVGIYKSKDATQRHICGGTIISANIVISAAHCFYDKANPGIYDATPYSVGAGKYFRDYNVVEPDAQFTNISEISIPSTFNVVSYQSDIAVLRLTNSFHFSLFVSAICIDWKGNAAQSIESGVNGQVSGWGVTQDAVNSIELRSGLGTTTSYKDCIVKAGTEWSSAISDDKFCILNDAGTTACEGDSGGGFIVEQIVNNKPKYFLWGIVSTGVPLGRVCKETEFVTYTNIQFYKNLITKLESLHRPK